MSHNVDHNDMVRDTSSEPNMAPHKRARSPSPLFMRQDTPLSPDRDTKRLKVDATTSSSSEDAFQDQPVPQRMDTPFPSAEQDERGVQQHDQSIPPNVITPSPTAESDKTEKQHDQSPSEAFTTASPATEARETTAQQPQPSSHDLSGSEPEQTAVQRQQSVSQSISAASIDHPVVLDHQLVLPANCPRLAAYHPLCEHIEKGVLRISNSFISVYEGLKTRGYQNEEIDRICSKLIQFSDVKKWYPKTKPVALVGPMGAGKSRTINTILDQQGLALDSDASDRGTNVVHEYHGPDHEQTEKYRVNVIYFTAPQLHTRIVESVTNIYKYLKTTDEEADDFEEDEEDPRSKYNDSISFFRTTLCARKEFRSKVDAELSFEEAYKTMSERKLAENLGKYLSDYKASRNAVDDVESHPAHDERELLQIFASVSKPQDADSKQPHPWPLIRKVQVHVRDNEILKRGAVVADTPGIADSNQMVVDSTTMYLQDVGIILLVSPILRTARLHDLDDVLRQCLRLNKTEGTYLVMTKIDQKDAPKDHEKASWQPEFRNAYDSAIARAQELTTELERLEVRRADLMPKLFDPEAIREFQATFFRHQELPRLIREQESVAFQANIQARNYDTSEALKGKFRTLSRSGRAADLKTVFVSNEEYQNLAAGKPARLDREATGIPSLQRLIYEVPAADKFGILQNICEQQLVVCLRGVIPSLTQTKLERKTEVEEELVSVLEDSPAIIDSLRQSHNRLFHDLIGQAFSENEQTWCERAERLIANWEGLNSMKFRTFCKKYGNWKLTKDGNVVHWNALIQDKVKDDVGLAFDDFWKGFDAAQCAAENNLRDHFDKLEEKLKACPGFQGVGQEFYIMVRHIRDETQRSIGRSINVFRQQLMDLYNDIVLRDDNGESFVDVVMKPIYAEAAEVKPAIVTTSTGKQVRRGKGAHKERADLIRRKLTGTARAQATYDSDDEEAEKKAEVQLSVFQSVFKHAKADFAQKLENFTEKAQAKLRTKTMEITSDFNRRFSVEEEQTAQDPQAKQLLLDAAHNALEALEGPVKDQLNECKRWEKEGKATTT